MGRVCSPGGMEESSTVATLLSRRGWSFLVGKISCRPGAHEGHRGPSNADTDDANAEFTSDVNDKRKRIGVNNESMIHSARCNMMFE